MRKTSTTTTSIREKEYYYRIELQRIMFWLVAVRLIGQKFEGYTLVASWREGFPLSKYGFKLWVKHKIRKVKRKDIREVTILYTTSGPVQLDIESPEC